MFWGTERIKAALPDLIDDPCVSRLDFASYHLRVGREVYVSPMEPKRALRGVPKILLEPNQGFVIPPGQFALILCEEEVRMPSDAIGFISMRAGYKHRGLVNVSGFHVDPGYKGHLIFSVFNAGPNPVPLARWEPCFVIWFADVDTKCPHERTGFNTIPSASIGALSRGMYSLESLAKRVERHGIYFAVLGILFGALFGGVLTLTVSLLRGAPMGGADAALPGASPPSVSGGLATAPERPLPFRPPP